MKAVPILMICGLAVSSLSAVPPQKKPVSPDVFLITIDTLRADHVHCYGDDAIQTPALDSLAKDGIRFAHVFTPSPITNTSHTTILTGLLPSSHGVTDFAVPLTTTHRTWAELLKSKGYHTAAFIGAVILDSKSLAPGLDRGFDFYDNFPEHTQTKSRWGRVERRGAEVVEHAETWLTAHPTGPHFVWVHLYDPHDPYEPPAPYSETYKDRLYDGEIAYSDSVLANFLSYLKKRGWYDNAIVVVVGDHGEGLGEHHEDTHGIFLYDSTIHVPLIMKLPAGANSAKVFDAQVRTTDILPTVLDLLRVAPPGELDGKSLKPYFAGAETTDRTAIGETDYPLRFGWAPLRSVRAEGFKFIEAPRPELYDLHADPGELKNGYEPSNATALKFRGVLAQLKPKTSGETASSAADTQGTKSDLQALGYTSGSNAAGANAAALPDPKDKIEEQNLLHAAMLATDDDRPADARTALEKVLQLDPKSPTALRQLGELELHAGDFSQAADHLKRAREVRPEDSTAAFYEGQAREKIRDLAGARDALEASLKLTPGQLPARLLLGQVYLRLKDPKAAEDQFEAALLVQADSVEAQMGVAKAQILEGNLADAVQQLEPLSRTQSENAEVFELLAQAYTGLGKNDEAQKAASRATSLRAANKKP
jgi:arylsulfatase A-like enzyme/Tfp pilus assembly protein PilF